MTVSFGHAFYIIVMQRWQTSSNFRGGGGGAWNCVRNDVDMIRERGYWVIIVTNRIKIVESLEIIISLEEVELIFVDGWS